MKMCTRCGLAVCACAALLVAESIEISAPAIPEAREYMLAAAIPAKHIDPAEVVGPLVNKAQATAGPNIVVNLEPLRLTITMGQIEAYVGPSV